jgi:hypothetical protein
VGILGRAKPSTLLVLAFKPSPLGEGVKARIPLKGSMVEYNA